MDAFVYFFTNLLFLNIVLASLAFLLGLFVGWLMWAKFKKRFHKSEMEIANLKSRLEFYRKQTSPDE